MALVSKEDGIEPLKEIATLKSESTLLALELTPIMEYGSFCAVRSIKSST